MMDIEAHDYDVRDDSAVPSSEKRVEHHHKRHYWVEPVGILQNPVDTTTPTSSSSQVPTLLQQPKRRRSWSLVDC